MISASAPGKIHLLGEHAVVYGKPALLTTIDLRVTVTLSTFVSLSVNSAKGIYSSPSAQQDKFKKTIEPIVKKELNIRTIPPYQLSVYSQLPIGAGLGSSAAISAAYIAALLSLLKVKWDLELVNNLTYEAEKIFHGNPSGGDNSTVVFGGLVWFQKASPDLKIIQSLPCIIPPKLAKNFYLINTGIPKESTKDMVEMVNVKCKVQSAKCKRLFDHQEQLVKNLVTALKDGNENELVQIIKAGEKNLESLGVVSSFVKSIIKRIEKAGGAAKICGGVGKVKATGVILVYHPDKAKIEKIAKADNLPYFTTSLGTDGVRMEENE